MKIAIPWVLVAALLAGCYWLYSEGRKKDADIARLTGENQEIAALRAQVDELKKTVVDTNEMGRLRKDNEELIALRGTLTQLRDQNRQLTSQLQMAQNQRSAAAEQQQQMSQLSAENQNLRNQAQQVQQAQAKAQVDACIQNLRMIDGAKQAWALENKKLANALPNFADLAPYMRNNQPPACPAGGTYSINIVNQPPTCSVAGHAIPRQ